MIVFYSIAPGFIDKTYIKVTLIPDTNRHIFQFRKPVSFGGVTEWSVHITCDDDKKTSIKRSFNTTTFANPDFFIENDKICAKRVSCQVSYILFSL